MKSLVVLLSIIFSAVLTYSQQFHSLNGIESPSGQTILLYRFGAERYESNPVFKYNVQTGYEQQIMDAHEIYLPVGADIKTVNDFEFFPGDTSNFINVGAIIYMDYGSYISRNDSLTFGYFAPLLKVDISKQDPQKVFVFGGNGPVRSWDGGYTFPEDSIPYLTDYIPMWISDFDDETYFGFNDDNQFVKNSVIVDTSTITFDNYAQLYFDVNRFHIYRVNENYGGYSFNVSNNKGNAFTWTKTFQSANPIYVSIDSTQSGVVYLADGRKIYKSTNNGYDFTEYRSLPSKLVGIYKKPNSDIIYAASKFQLYEIKPDEINVIKTLDLPAFLFEFYPLHIGDFWKYKVESWDYMFGMSYSEDVFTRKVISKETLLNNKEYFKIMETYVGSSYSKFVYERVDSSTGLVYGFDNQCTNPDSEKVIDNLAAEVGDSILIQRFTSCWDSVLTLFSSEKIENIFDSNRIVKTFECNWLIGYSYKLANNIGLSGLHLGYDSGTDDFILKGCVINGVLYGDTTFVVDVKTETNPVPAEFKLYQNYPNPFNPSTVISYQLPVTSNVTLKVYDVLGKKIATLVNEEKPAGKYEVEFTVGQDSSPDIASGVYYYELRSGSFVETKKMILLR